MIRILIVDDSMVITLLLKAIFEAETDMEVVGIATDGEEAVRLVKSLKPDLVTMDIRMPKMDGIEAIRLIMRDAPCPIVVVSSFVDDVAIGTNFTAIDAGALACVTKPVATGAPDFKMIHRDLIDTVRSMSQIKTIHRRHTIYKEKNVDSNQLAPPTKVAKRSFELVAIGASTGGPQALQKIFNQIVVSFPLPILLTQHMSNGFVSGLISWLGETSRLPIELAVHGNRLEPGHVYIAPDGQHLGVNRDSAEHLLVSLNDGPLVNGFRPSATPMFKSVASVCNKAAIGVMLTGMGKDGASGLLALHEAGGYTIAQDEASSIVYGMPAAAVEIGAVDETIELDNMADYLLILTGSK